MNTYRNNLAEFFAPTFQKFDKCCIENAADIRQMRSYELEQTKRATFQKLLTEYPNTEQIEKLADKRIDTFEYAGDYFTFNEYLKLYEVFLLFHFNQDSSLLIGKNLEIADYHLTIKE